MQHFSVALRYRRDEGRKGGREGHEGRKRREKNKERERELKWLEMRERNYYFREDIYRLEI